VTVCLFVFAVECVAVSNVVFMKETDRQCSVSRLVLYCVTVLILLFGVVCVIRSAMLCLWKDQADSSVCYVYSAVLCDSAYIDICCCVCYGQQCCVYGRNRQTVQCARLQCCGV